MLAREDQKIPKLSAKVSASNNSVHLVRVFTSKENKRCLNYQL